MSRSPVYRTDAGDNRWRCQSRCASVSRIYRIFHRNTPISSITDRREGVIKAIFVHLNYSPPSLCLLLLIIVRNRKKNMGPECGIKNGHRN